MSKLGTGLALGVHSLGWRSALNFSLTVSALSNMICANKAYG